METNHQLSDVLNQLQSLSERMANLEAKLMLVPDIDRYSKLQEFLVASNFKEADAETTSVILETINRTRDTLTPDDIMTFPCSVLQVLDRLWKTYSQNRFGFSVQLQIYQHLGGSIDTLRRQDVSIIEQFGEEVGWRVNEKWQGDTYEQWNFSLSSPVGCFPAIWWKSPYGLKMVNYCFMRLLECNLT